MIELYQGEDGSVHFKVHDRKTLEQLERNTTKQGLSLDEFIRKALDAATAAFQVGYESPPNSAESTAVCLARRCYAISRPLRLCDSIRVIF